jgi:hypothetical protein
VAVSRRRGDRSGIRRSAPGDLNTFIGNSVEN